MREFKYLPAFIKDIDDKTRSVVGICSVFNHIDDIDDRVWPGSFQKTLKEGRQRVRHLWNHDWSSPTIASITNLQEVSRDALPEKVLEYAPEASGGLEVTRSYYENVDLSNWVYEAIKRGDIDEMSFGYDAIRFEWTIEGEGSAERRIRELRELKLYDTSDVLWGCNDATVAAKGLLPLDAIASNLTLLHQAIKSHKAGRRNAESDLSMINTIHNLCVDLGCTTCAGVSETEAGKGKAATDSGTIIALPPRQAMDNLRMAVVFGGHRS
ncbi:MAG TPA: HK97 family phage prohead protease [Pyrinomonadaceae bacterium]|nr:HK97 family phage prohead protease [Pyrinomonadaceae bacterium]